MESDGEYEIDPVARAYGEYEINPIAKAYPAAVMEHLGRAAAEAKDEAQAESFIGALVPLALSSASIDSFDHRRDPHLIQGAANVTEDTAPQPDHASTRAGDANDRAQRCN